MTHNAVGWSVEDVSAAAAVYILTIIVKDHEFISLGYKFVTISLYMCHMFEKLV